MMLSPKERISKLKEAIDRGRKGLNQGLSIGMPKLEQFIDGLTQETYYLIAGGTGSGKTSFAIYSFIYKPLLDNMDNDDFNIIYFSLEMTEEQLLAKLAGLYIFEKYGIELSFKDIFSRGKDNILDDEHYELVLESFDFLEKVCGKLIIHDEPVNTLKIHELLLKDMELFGSEDSNGRFQLTKPNHIIAVVLDHIGLIKTSQGNSKKDEIDLASSLLTEARNYFKISPIVLSQINRGSSSMDRRKSNMNEIQLDDLKNSGNPSEDANIVLALFYPFREKMTTYKGYDITVLEDKFRSVVILKNRFGSADLSVGLGFYGKIGYFRELPRGDQIRDYFKYLSSEWVLESEEKQDTTFQGFGAGVTTEITDNSEINLEIIL